MLAGGERPFDEPACSASSCAATSSAPATSRPCRTTTSIQDDGGDYPPVSSIAVPTLVIHGTADPMFPIGHGEALAEEIPDARLLRLEGAGHGVYRADWEAIVAAILEHT